MSSSVELEKALARIRELERILATVDPALIGAQAPAKGPQSAPKSPKGKDKV